MIEEPSPDEGTSGQTATERTRGVVRRRPSSTNGLTVLEACALVDDGPACALEYNVVRPGTALALPQAGLAVFVANASGGLGAVRVYGYSGS